MAKRIKFGVRIHQGGYGYEALRDVWREADSLGFYSASLYDLLNAARVGVLDHDFSPREGDAPYQAGPAGAGQPVPPSCGAGEDGGDP